MRSRVGVLLLLFPSALGAGCQPTSVEATGTARTSATARASDDPEPSAKAPPVEAPTALATQTATATSTGAFVAPGPAISKRTAPPKLQGFEVYDSDGLTVSFKSYYVDNVDQQKDASYPGCPTEDLITRQKGTIEALDGPDHSILFQVGGRFGAMTSRSYSPHGEYGDQVECCVSGDEVAASSLRPTLTREEAVRAATICQRLMAMHAP